MDLITVSRKAGMEFGIRVRGHQVTSDMSARDGGRDQGPSPVELFAGALGACIAMTVQGYCTAHGYDGDVGVSLTLELADKPKRIGRLVVDLEPPPSVPAAKREALRRVAALCPIHETLRCRPEVDIDIV
ncbi:MAG: OsmC family protein [Planctomycetota bacterium]